MKSYQHVVGALKSYKGGEAIGESVAGGTTRIIMLADSNRNPVHFEVSVGKACDSRFAVPQIYVSDAEYIMADKASRSKTIREILEAKEY